MNENRNIPGAGIGAGAGGAPNANLIWRSCYWGTSTTTRYGSPHQQQPQINGRFGDMGMSQFDKLTDMWQRGVIDTKQWERMIAVVIKKEKEDVDVCFISFLFFLLFFCIWKNNNMIGAENQEVQFWVL